MMDLNDVRVIADGYFSEMLTVSEKCIYFVIQLSEMTLYDVQLKPSALQ
jgi:hypothetical protein